MDTKFDLFGKVIKVISLNQDLCFDSKSNPGHPPAFKREIISRRDKDGFENYVHHIADHSFRPHIDAPNHYSDSEQGAEKFSSLNNLFHKVLVIDLTHEKETEEVEGLRIIKEILLKHIERFSDDISKVSALIIRTGYDKWTENLEKHELKNIPYFSHDAAMFLSSFENLKVIGTDSINIDKPNENSIHKIFTNMMIIEGLVNLSAAPESGCILMVSPLIIEGATGAPAKVYIFTEAD